MLANTYYFQPFLKSQSHVVIDDFSFGLNYTTSQWTINMTLHNLSDIAANKTFDSSLLQIYSLTRDTYYSILRKKIDSGLPTIAGHSTIQDSFVINLNPNDFPAGETIINYNYFNSLGLYDVQRQSIIKHFLLVHDHVAPILSVSLPSIIETNVPCTIQASITDSNPFSYSIIANSSVLDSGLINVDSFQNSSGTNKETISSLTVFKVSHTVLFPKTGTYSLKIIASDLGLNQTVFSTKITVYQPTNIPPSNSTTTTTTSTTQTTITSSSFTSSQSSFTDSSSKSPKSKHAPFITFDVLLLALIILPITRKVKK